MSGFTNRKNWLSGLLTVSLAVIPTCTITAEENSKIVDRSEEHTSELQSPS